MLPQDATTATPDTTDTPNFGVSQSEIDRIKAVQAAQKQALRDRAQHIDKWCDRLESDGQDTPILLLNLAKHTITPGWQTGTADTVDWERLRGAVHHGSNIGLLLGASRRVAWDADNALGTAAFSTAGIHIHHVSPGSLHPQHDHAGGCTTLWRLPDWVPDVRLTGPEKAVMLANGGKIDVLAGNHQIVLPPSVVAYKALGGYVGPYRTGSAAGYCSPGRDGWLLEDRNEDLWLPLWAMSEELRAYAPAGAVTPEAMAIPPGLEALAGSVTTWEKKESDFDPETRDELTEMIDDLDLLTMLEEAGVDGERRGFFTCGPCEMWLRAESTAEKSIVVHGGCEHGYRVQVFTTGIDSLPAGGYSRLDAFIGLTGRDIATHRGAEMARLGLITADRLATADLCDTSTAAEWEERVEDGTFSTADTVVVVHGGVARLQTVRADAAYWLEKARLRREQARIIRGVCGSAAGTGQPVETTATTASWGSPASTPYPAPPVQEAAPVPGEQQEPLDVEAVPLPGESAPGAEMDVDDAIDGELVGGVDAAELEKVIRDLRGKIVVIETMMRDLTPGTRRISDYAESQGVYPHGLTCALLGRALAGVPPNVVLPPRNGNCSHKVLGSGVNVYTCNVAVSSAGKGETENAAEAAIPLPLGVAAVGMGTSEYWSKQLRGVVDGKPQIKTTSLYAVVDEMDAFNAYLSQPGNKMPGWITSTYQNGYGGQGTSDEKNSASLPKHGSRIGIHINSQFEKMGILAAHAAIGAEARFIQGNAGVVGEGDEGPLFGITVPPVMADQSNQPWYNPGHVADPPVMCQQPQGARDAAVAAGGAPVISGMGSHRDADGEEVPGHRGFDDAEPIWIPLPPKAKAAIKEARQVSAALAKDPTLALKKEVSAHRLMVRLHAMVGFCVIDGGWQPTDDHWDAADLLVHGSDLVAEACRAYIKLQSLTAAFEAGEVKGAMYAGSKASEVSITGAGVESAMLGILGRLQKAGGSAKPRDIRNGVTGSYGGLSKSQRPHMRQAFAKLEQAKQVYLATDGTWNLGQPPGAVAA